MTVEELSILLADIEYDKENTYSGDWEFDDGINAITRKVIEILLRKGNLDEDEDMDEFNKLVEEYK